MSSNPEPDYWVFTKPEVTFLMVISSVVGFYLGCPFNSEGFLLIPRACRGSR